MKALILKNENFPAFVQDLQKQQPKVQAEIFKQKDKLGSSILLTAMGYHLAALDNLLGILYSTSFELCRQEILKQVALECRTSDPEVQNSPEEIAAWCNLLQETRTQGEKGLLCKYIMDLVAHLAEQQQNLSIISKACKEVMGNQPPSAQPLCFQWISIALWLADLRIQYQSLKEDHAEKTILKTLYDKLKIAWEEHLESDHGWKAVLSLRTAWRKGCNDSGLLTPNYFSFFTTDSERCIEGLLKAVWALQPIIPLQQEFTLQPEYFGAN